MRLFKVFTIKRLIIRFTLVWYDLWVGFYYDEKHGILYFTPIPMLPIQFQILPISIAGR